jgi:hypothetical protein
MWNYLLTVRFGGICSAVTTRQMLKKVSLVLTKFEFDIQAFLLGAASFWARNEKPRFVACGHSVKMHLLQFFSKTSENTYFLFHFLSSFGFLVPSWHTISSCSRFTFKSVSLSAQGYSK